MDALYELGISFNRTIRHLENSTICAFTYGVMFAMDFPLMHAGIASFSF
jgi:hypothetical protein